MTQTQAPSGTEAAAGQPRFEIAPGPHVVEQETTTRRMMADVLIGLVPLAAAATIVFGLHALMQLGICIAGCVLAEAIFTRMRSRPATVGDLSAVVTGAILALSLPWSAPWYVGGVGSFVAIGIGKIVFGGLGNNIFNPAMVGRAFAMMAWPGALAAAGYLYTDATASGSALNVILGWLGISYQPWAAAVDVMSQATPLTALRQAPGAGGPDWALLGRLVLGNTNGSLGETSAVAALVGGAYLCVRRTASWQIPASMILAAAVVAGAVNAFAPQASWTALHHLAGGAMLFGAFFIATDPVTSPLTSRGKWIFGAGVGVLVMLMRTMSAYPEGVMFSVLLMNALVPLINRSTIPRPVGGPAPQET